jgi:hypothetical protein
LQAPRELDLLSLVANQDGILTIRFSRSMDAINNAVEGEKFIDIHATDDLEETPEVGNEIEHFSKDVGALGF